MKKITLCLSMFLAFISAQAQLPEGFEGAIFPPAGWASFIGANGFGTVENWQSSTYAATGAGAAMVFYEDSGEVQEDWLVTPQVTITPTAPYLLFTQAQGFGADYGTTYEIRVSTTSQTAHASFATILSMTESDLGLTYSDRQVDLSAYIGVPIYIAFVMINNNGDAWLLDDVRLSETSVAAPTCASTPSPTDGATNVPYGPITLSWEAPTTGDPATSYDIYAGDSPATLQYLTTYTTTSTGTDLTINAYNTLVYWQVVPKNAAGPATGCSIWSFTTEEAPGYCLDAIFNQYPSETFTPATCDGLTENVIVTDAYAGEYSLVNVTVGQSYTFISSVATDYITIGNADGDTALAYGVTPVTWVANIDGVIRFYTHTDIECGFDSTPRTRSVTCGFSSTDTPDYANLQYPATASIVEGTTTTVYGQVYEGGLTDVEPGISGQATGIQAWVGINTNNTDPATWDAASWTLADHNAFSIGNNDEYMSAVGANLNAGTYYYATRFRLNGGPYVYGGTDGTNGNFWDGTTYNSGVLTVTMAPPPVNDECTGAIALVPGGNFPTGAITTTNFGATATDGPPSCQGSASESVWYTVIVPASGNITIETGYSQGSYFYDSIITVFSGACGVLTELACNDDETNGFSMVSLTGQTPGTTLYVSVWQYTGPLTTGASGAFQISAYDASLGTQTFSSDQFSYSPNPVENILNFSNTVAISQVEIFNLLGQNVMAKTLNSSHGQIDLSTLSQGTYLVKVISEDGIRTIKIVKD